MKNLNCRLIILYTPKVWMLTFLAFGICSCNKPVLSNQPIEEEPEPTAYQLVWSDEFSTDGLPDSTKWNYDVGGHGWGNNELQFYTKRPENARVENGLLIIEARREAYQGQAYTSARLVSRDRQHWTYGRIAARAQLPSGRGTWPAIWMLGVNISEVGWPVCGEIDIMEHVGYVPDSLYGTVHTEAFNHVAGTQVGGSRYLPDAEESFHIYGIEWTPEKIDFLVDEEVYFTFSKRANANTAEWPFDADHYLLMNLAVGGSWGGAQGVNASI